jgi:hypothetical protein
VHTQGRVVGEDGFNITALSDEVVHHNVHKEFGGHMRHKLLSLKCPDRLEETSKNSRVR